MSERPDISPPRPLPEPSEAAVAYVKRLRSVDFEDLQTVLFVPRAAMDEFEKATGQVDALGKLKAAVARKFGAIVALPENLA